MHIAQTALALFTESDAPWRADWLWGCPLILITVILHASGLAAMCRRIVLFEKESNRRQSDAVRAFLVASMTLLATLLHAMDAFIWSVAYRVLGVFSDARSAMLYSLGAMTTFGSAARVSQPHWELLGVIESLNGVLLFGLSTAFLFWLLQEMLPTLRR